MAPKKTRNYGSALSQADRVLLGTLVADCGVAVVAEAVEVAPQTVYRARRGEKVAPHVRDRCRAFLAKERQARNAEPATSVRNAAPVVTKDNAAAIGVAVSSVTEALLPLSNDERKRVLDSVAVLLG